MCPQSESTTHRSASVLLTGPAHFPEGLPPVPRLGVATRSNTRMESEDVHCTFEPGVRNFTWCVKLDWLSRAISSFGERRRKIVLTVQLRARSAAESEREMDWILAQTGDRPLLGLGTPHYVELEDK